MSILVINVRKIPIHLFFAVSAIIVLGYVCGDDVQVSLVSQGDINGNLTRHRRQIYRGQNNYYQRSYDINRLRYEKYEKYMRPRIRPYFQRTSDKYPDNPNLIKSYENFSDQKRRHGTKSYDSRGSDKSSSRKPMMLPTTLFQSELLRNRYQMRSFQQYYPQQQTKSPKQTQSRDPLFGQSIDPYNQPKGSFYNQPQDASYNQPQDASYNQPQDPVYNQPRDSVYNQPRDPLNNQPIDSSYNQPVNPQYGERTGNQPQSYRPTSYSSSRLPSSSFSNPQRPPQSSFVPQSPPRIRNSTFVGIPGWIRRDYPGYYQVPYTGFRCDLQSYYGYYADTAAGCQVFHVCQTDGRKSSFLCPNGTLFHQKVQTCDWWYHVDCPSSPSYYYLNARIGVLPPLPATLHRFP